MISDADIERKILSLLTTRTSGPNSADKTICPSEVARGLWPEKWRNPMDAVRMAAGKLACEESIAHYAKR